MADNIFAENNKLKTFALNNYSSKVKKGLIREGYVIGKLVGYIDINTLFIADNKIIEIYELESGMNSLGAIKDNYKRYNGGFNKLVLFDNTIPDDTLMILISDEIVSPVIDKNEVEQLIKQLEL